ncbi:MAG TPA: tetratricopeptide repeat protein, partial [Myxococcaceae bacterium]|nr:tetratricopeptide repeat protein [Myxococcaceae bacterium]
SSALTRGDRKRAEAQYRKALESFEKALAADPGSVPAAVGLGAVGQALQDYERVAEKLAPVYAAHPESVELAYSLGISLFKLRRYEEAVPLLQQVSAANQPEHLLVHYYLGNYYVLGTQQGEEGVAELQAYLSQRPEKLAANDYQIHELLGRGHLLRGDTDAARVSFERAQYGRTESVSIQMGLALVMEMEGRLGEAMALLDGLSVRFPQVPEVRERLGRLLLQSGNTQGAEVQALAQVKIGSTPTAHLLLGDVRMAQERFAEAEADYRKVLELAPGYVGAQIAVGMALQKQGRNEEAVSFLEQAAQAGANSVELWATLGSVNRRAGRYQRAVEVHRRVVELTPGQALGHVLLGADHFATGQWDQAIDDYAAALQAEPEHPGAKLWLARALAHRAKDRATSGRVDDAVRDLRRAFDLERTSAMARRLGAALLEQKGHDEARRVLEEGATLPEADWRVHMLLGYARLGTGQAEEALAAFEQAGKLAPDVAALSDVSAGTALAEMELGRTDEALQRLAQPGNSKSAIMVTKANLSRAHLRRAFLRLEAGDAAGARQDLESAERAGIGKQKPALDRLSLLARALVQVEEGRFNDAGTTAKRALTPSPEWSRSNARRLLEAFILYRRDSLPRARRLLALATKRSIPEQSQWIASLEGSIYRRDAERSYEKGSMRGAQRALEAALKDTPNDPILQHNLACVMYRQRKVADAVATWRKLEDTVPQAILNLGIDAQVRRRNVSEAVAAYHRYVATGGPRSATVREWKERLQALYGISDSILPSEESDDSEGSVEPSTATAAETTP